MADEEQNLVVTMKFNWPGNRRDYSLTLDVARDRFRAEPEKVLNVAMTLARSLGRTLCLLLETELTAEQRATIQTPPGGFMASKGLTSKEAVLALLRTPHPVPSDPTDAGGRAVARLQVYQSLEQAVALMEQDGEHEMAEQARVAMDRLYRRLSPEDRAYLDSGASNT